MLKQQETSHINNQRKLEKASSSVLVKKCLFVCLYVLCVCVVYV